MDPREIKDNLRDKGYTKAARFLMLLGKEEAARVMKHLDEQEVAGITKEIAQVDKIESTEATKILEEFGYLIKTQDLVARGALAWPRRSCARPLTRSGQRSWSTG